METLIEKIQLTELNLEPGAVLAVTIKSDSLTQASLDAVRKGFSEKFPNNPVVVMAMGTNEDVSFTKIVDTGDLQ